MSLKEFERKLEALFEGFFTRSFKSGVQPIELAKKLVREMERNKTVSIERIYAPNEYTLYLSEEDKKNLESIEEPLLSELKDFLMRQAKKDGLTFISPPEIKISARDDLSLGEIGVESKLVKKSAVPAGKQALPRQAIPIGPPGAKPPFGTGRAGRQAKPVIDQTQLMPMEEPIPPKGMLMLKSGARREFPLTKPLTTLGRLPTNDIVLPDPNVSRIHAEIRLEERGLVIRDLKSTNGTLVNGKRIEEQLLRDGDLITLGTTELEFRSSEDV
ncbi:MAG: DUF3662 and FHA domain-containing protein [Actinomycetota bacterium]|nr:DUF3662 and FHA domain-containing protein [Actinomycetota bacterium]